MPSAAPAPVEDHSELRSRASSVVIGSRLTLAAVAAAAAYALATWGEPQRAAIVWLLAAAATWVIAPLGLGAARIAHSSRREALFVTWSVGALARIGAIVLADGGWGSPLALLFFLPIAFAALSYPLPSVALIGAIDVLTFV